jgi:hypothetical protein
MAMTVMFAASRVCAADACQGPRPQSGAIVRGPVLDVPDGSSICVAAGASPSTWVKLPLSRLQTTRLALMAAAFGKNAICLVGVDGAADCVIEGSPLASVLGQTALLKAALAWR